jgi:hypothetical protein
LENETAVNLDEPEWTPQRLRDGIDVLARHQVELETVVKSMGELCKAMDLRIRALTGLVDYHHELLTKLAGLPPRPKGDPRAN